MNTTLISLSLSVVTVIETGTETAVFLPNRTETAVNSRLESSRPLVSLAGVIVGIKGEIAGGGGHAPRVCA